jgi:hypothetical protein
MQRYLGFAAAIVLFKVIDILLQFLLLVVRPSGTSSRRSVKR